MFSNTILRYIFAITLCLWVIDLSLAAERWAPKEAIATFAFVNDGRGITIPVKIEGRSWEFIVDTGSGVSFIDIRLKSLLGERLGKQNIDEFGALEALERFKAPKMSCGDLEISLPRGIVCMNMAYQRRGGSAPAYGILGMDWLNQFVVHFDFDNSIMVFLRELNKSTLPPGQRIAASFRAYKSPSLAIGFADNVHADVDIDTGMEYGGILGNKLVNLLLEGGHGKRSSVTFPISLAILETPKASLIRCKKITVGNYFQNGPMFMFFPENKRSCLGASFLQRFRVTFVPNEGAIYLDPGSRYKSFDHGDCDGLAFLKTEKGEIRIDAVEEGSIGEMAGLKVGDVCISIDNTPTYNCGIDDLQRKLMIDRRKDIYVEIMRGDMKRKVILGTGSR